MMTDEYRTILRICEDFPGCIFRNEEDLKREVRNGIRYSDPYIAIGTPGQFVVHEIKRGLAGQPKRVYTFEEARHVGA